MSQSNMARRGGMIAAGIGLSALTFWLAWDEFFDPLLLAAWGGSMIVWWHILSGQTMTGASAVGAVREPPLEHGDDVRVGAQHAVPLRAMMAQIRTMAARLRAMTAQIRTTQALSLLLILVLGAAVFYVNLDRLPDDMIADHAEYIFDVQRVRDGETWLYFAANSGREPGHLYLGAFMALFAGVNFMAIKLVSATAALLTLPALYLIGRDADSPLTGLLAAFFGAVAAWHVIFARLGFRVALASLAAAWLMWALLRALRSGRRGHFLLAGVILGLGLYGYAAFRIAPLFVLVALALAGLARMTGREARAIGGTTRTTQASSLPANGAALFMMALVVFMPLLSYTVHKPGIYWFRASALIGGVEQNAFAQIFDALTESLLMFNFGHDPVALNLVAPGAPVLMPPLGVLFLAGLGLWLWRAYARADWLGVYVPLAFLIFLLPSALALNTPLETPSARRAIAALPAVLLLAALALALLMRRLAALRWRRARALAVVVCCIIAGGIAAAEIGAYVYFYPPSYRPEPHRAIAEYIDGFARRGSSLENAYVVYQDRWVDVRIIGIWLGSTRAGGWIPLLADFDAVDCELLTANRLGGDVLVIVAPGDNASLLRVLECFTPPGSADPDIIPDPVRRGGVLLFNAIIAPAEGGTP